MPLTGGPPVGYPMMIDDFGYVPPPRPRPQPYRPASPPVASRPRPRPTPQRPAPPPKPRVETVARQVDVPSPDALGIGLDTPPLVIPSPDDLGIDPH